MESGHRSGGGALPGGGAEGAGGGLLCHACGYPYPNAHPSAKQRRAHRKNCGKTPSASAAADEEGVGVRDGKGLLLGEGGGGGIGTGAAECGGSFPGSALEVGDAVGDGNNAEHSSRDGAEVRSIVHECAEVTPEANKTDSDVTLPEVATQYSEKALHLLDENPSDPVVSSEQLQDISTTLVQPEPEDAGSRFSCVMSRASNATGDGTSEQINDVVSQLTDNDVTEVDGMTNTIGKLIPSEDKSVIGGEFGSSCQGSLQTKIFEGHSSTAVEEDPSEKNVNAVHNDEIPTNETEYNQQSKLNSVEQVPDTEEPVESCTEKSVGADDYSCDDLTKLGTGSCHSEAPEYVKPQQQPDTTPETAYHRGVPKQVDIDKGQDYPNTDGGIQAISSASGPAVDAEDASVGSADNVAKNVCSSDVTMGEIILENVNSGTAVPCQVNLVELSTCDTVRGINMISSTNNVDEKMQNEKIGAALATPEMNEVHNIENLEEKLQNKETTAESTSLDTNVVCRTDNSCKISAVQITSSIEEKEQIDEVIADLASEKINHVTSSRDLVEETEQKEVDIETNHGGDVACSIETIEGKNTTSKINAGNTTDNSEDNKQSEEISLIYTTVNEENMYSEDITEHPSSHETVVVDSTNNVEETKSEDTMADPTSDRIGVVTATGSVENRQEEEITQDPASCQINVAPTTDNVEIKKHEEPILDPTTCKISMISSTDDVEEKQQNEGTTADPSSGENNTPQSTGDAAKGMKDGVTTTDPVPDDTKEAQGTDTVGERGQEESAAKEISTVKSTDDLKATDQSEEIADKEMVTDSERNHVSLKVLLTDKSVETKEKKASAKDRVLSFKRRSSKDNVSPVKPGSPKAGSGQQDWNSPARLPTEKKPKGRKQQWVPFICCPSIH